MRRTASLRFACAALAGFPPVACAQSAAHGEQVTVTGCVSKGVEAGCWVLTDSQGNRYSFTSDSAAANQCLVVSGTPALGFCSQGTQLAVGKAAPADNHCCKQK